MDHDGEKYDMMSIGVVAIVAIITVVLMVVNLAPGAAATEKASSESVRGKAFDYGTTCVPIAGQFDWRPWDFNADGRMDFYDYQDVLAGKIDCQTHACDLNHDGFIDGIDATAFNLLVRRVYDYNGDLELNRGDPRIVADIIYGNGDFSKNHVYDLNGDGLLCSSDLTLWTSLLFNYDNPSLP